MSKSSVSNWRVVVGVGSGRCGTHSLACLLDAQPHLRVSHEHLPLLPWDNSKGGFGLRRRFEEMHEKRGGHIVGDVAFYYLNYLERILEEFPSARIVALKRSCEETVSSFERWIGRHGWNHWTSDRQSVVTSGYDHCYPTYGACTLREGAQRYWNECYERLEDLSERYEQIAIWPTEALSDDDGISSILDHVGVNTDRRLVHMHLCRTTLDFESGRA